MTVALAVLPSALLGFLGLALLLGALPFHARARGGARNGQLSGQLRATWAFGLVALELSATGVTVRVAGLAVFRPRRAGRAALPARAAEGEAAGEGLRRSGLARVRGALENRRPLLRMAARLVGALHLRLRLAGRLGLGDPADTAALSGVLEAVRALPGVELSVELDWLGEALDLMAEGSARLWLPEALGVAGFLLLRRENRAALRAVMA